MSPFIANWGIIGCGWISSMFVKDLCVARDDVKDVSHAVVAVGSRDKSRAEAFINDFCPNGTPVQQNGLVKTVPLAFGSYTEVFTNEDVNIIYIGTPNTSHYNDARAALEAKKNVLVEKPACLNATEWDELSSFAKSQGCFLMEGVWTRFLPLAYELQKELFEKKSIGDVKSVVADFSMLFEGIMSDTHRCFALEKAGGSMYDLGPYVVLMALLALYHDPANELSPPSNVNGTMLKGHTGVDIATNISMTFPKIGATATLLSSFTHNSPKDERCTITGTKGEIVLHDGLSRITSMTVKTIDQEPAPRPTNWKRAVKVDRPLPGFGLMYEADAVARSLQGGELENPRMPHAETALTLEIFDSIRKANGYVLPEGLEALK